MIKFKDHKNKFNLSIKILAISLVFILNIFTKIYATDFNNDLYKKRTNWYPAEGTNLNISHYVYHDMNRNGIYDIGDKPLVQFAIKMTRPDGTTVIRRSNLNGFTNFTNSMISSPVDVSEPGEYTFELIVPDGWKTTSNNKIQTVNYRKGTTERSSIIADKVPIPVGVIQEPKISGKIKRKNIKEIDTKNIKVTALSPKGESKDIELNKKGEFFIVGDYGDWSIRVVDKKERLC